jgi:uncharacterized membrane protein YesL
MAFWVCYDHLGKLMLANVVWAVLVALPGSMALAALFSGDPAFLVVIGVPATWLTLGVALPVASAGIAHMAKELIETRDGSVATFFAGMRRYGMRAAVLGTGYLALFVVVLIAAWFYAVRGLPGVPWLGFILSALAVWALVFIVLSALMAIPALVQKKAGPWATFKLAGALVLANPVMAIGLAIQLAAITFICGVAAPLFFFLYGSAVVVLLSSAYEMLARKYAAQADPDAPPPDDEDDDYLNRGFRDFLFPWKS